jgi:hypothetical protein
MPGLSPKRKLRVGYAVFGTLAGLKVIEYVIALALPVGAWPYLAALALVSAGLIIYYYKHIHQLWRPEGKE